MSKRKPKTKPSTAIVVRNTPPPDPAAKKTLFEEPRPASMLPLNVLLKELASRYSHSVFVGWLNPEGTPDDTISDPVLFTVETTGHPDAATYLMGMAQRQLYHEQGVLEGEFSVKEEACPTASP